MERFEERFEALGLSIPRILLPSAGVDKTKWGVVACDQFTSEQGYWIDVKKTVGKAPSTFRMILPECYLDDPSAEGRIASIWATMKDYLVNERARVLLEYFDIGEFANQIMSGFSKGMKQKVLLCSAMIHQPDIYFFDEPLNGLDAQATLLFKELLKQFAAKGKTILYCSHLLDTVERLCTKIIVIHNGSIVAEGTIGELKASTKQENLDEVFSALTSSENRVDKTTALLNALDALQS